MKKFSKGGVISSLPPFVEETVDNYYRLLQGLAYVIENLSLQ